jgi:hypothetical protein
MPRSRPVNCPMKVTRPVQKHGAASSRRLTHYSPRQRDASIDALRMPSRRAVNFPGRICFGDFSSGAFIRATRDQPNCRSGQSWVLGVIRASSSTKFTLDGLSHAALLRNTIAFRVQSRHQMRAMPNFNIDWRVQLLRELQCR